MTPPLENLRDLRPEPPDADELMRLVEVARTRLRDAGQPGLSIETRFSLAYGSAHAASVAALRRLGYRTSKRYLVFQLLPQTLGLDASVWRVLDRAHEKRNLLEYEGMTDIEPQLVADTLVAASQVLAAWTDVTGQDAEP